jgi:hypothetical protein
MSSANIGGGGGGLTSPVGETDGGTGQTTYTTGDVLYSDASNSLAKLPIASIPGSIFVADDSGIVSWSDDIVLIHDDFIEPEAIAGVAGNWSHTKTATGDFDIGPVDSGHPGIKKLSVAASGDDAISYRSTQTGDVIALGGGFMRIDFIIKIDTLADATDDYDLWLGLSDSTAFISEVNTTAVAVEYQRSNSVNWTGLTRSASTTTVASGGSTSAVDTNWTHIRIDINADATNVDFYVDGTDIGSSTTNIPSAGMFPFIKMTKTAGTNARSVGMDVFRLYQKLTTTRWT